MSSFPDERDGASNYERYLELEFWRNCADSMLDHILENEILDEMDVVWKRLGQEELARLERFRGRLSAHFSSDGD